MCRPKRQQPTASSQQLHSQKQLVSAILRPHSHEYSSNKPNGVIPQLGRPAHQASERPATLSRPLSKLERPLSRGSLLPRLAASQAARSTEQAEQTEQTLLVAIAIIISCSGRIVVVIVVIVRLASSRKELKKGSADRRIELPDATILCKLSQIEPVINKQTKLDPSKQPSQSTCGLAQVSRMQQDIVAQFAKLGR